MQTLADRLKWAREATGLSARGLARAAGLQSERHIGFLENGERDNPELKTLQSIATALGCSIGWLANGDEPVPDAESVRITARAAFDRAEADRKDAKAAS